MPALRSALPPSEDIASEDIAVAPHHRILAPAQSREALDDPKSAPLGLLPIPTPADVTGFAVLYERKYGVKLDSDQAGRLLSGLMRFLYLTRTESPSSSSADPLHSVAPNPINPVA